MKNKWLTLNQHKKNALDLMQQVNIVSAHIPGSEASKIQTHNKIRSYYGLFGLPHIYIPLNSCAAHSPFSKKFLEMNLQIFHYVI